jgi:hypothetical protein
MAAVNGPRWWPTSPPNTLNTFAVTGVHRPLSTPTPGSPGRCFAATSRSGTGRASTQDAAPPPAAPTSTTPLITATAELLPARTPDRYAGTITGSNTSAGGGCTNPNLVTSPGSALWVGHTARSLHRSSTTYPTLGPGPIMPTWGCWPGPTTDPSWNGHHPSRTRRPPPRRRIPTSRHPSEVRWGTAGCSETAEAGGEPRLT